MQECLLTKHKKNIMMKFWVWERYHWFYNTDFNSCHTNTHTLSRAHTTHARSSDFDISFIFISTFFSRTTYHHSSLKPYHIILLNCILYDAIRKDCSKQLLPSTKADMFYFVWQYPWWVNKLHYYQRPVMEKTRYKM